MCVVRGCRRKFHGSSAMATTIGIVVERKPRTLFGLLVASLLLLLVPVFQVVVVEASEGGLDPSSTQPCSLRDALMDPTYEKRYGANVVWQIPPNAKASLYFAHGGDQDSLRYFDAGPKCEQCHGMPEERRVVLEALRRGYAVIAVQSLGNNKASDAEDPKRVTKIINEWTREHSLEGLPLAAWAHSSGASLVTAVAFRLPMQAMVFICGQGNLKLIEKATAELFPPTLFVYMLRDVEDPTFNVSGLQSIAMAMLSERGVKVYDTPCWPKQISPLLFAERIPCMSDEMSREVFAAYQDAGWVDSYGYLTKNPWFVDWLSVLWEARALPYCTATGGLCLAEDVLQELNLAYALHAFTSDKNLEIFPWLDSTIFSSLSGEEPGYQRPRAATI